MMNQGTQVCWESASSGRIFGHGWPLSPHNRPTRSWPIIGIQFLQQISLFTSGTSLCPPLSTKTLGLIFELWIEHLLGAIKGEDVHSWEATQKISRVQQYIKIELNMKEIPNMAVWFCAWKLEAPKKIHQLFSCLYNSISISMRNSFENHDWVPTHSRT